MNSAIIFYCDDDEDDLILFSEIINEIDPGLRCVLESRSEDAVKTLSHHIPDIIILDINMPKISGIELLEWIKRHPPLNTVPVVMYSSSINPREANYCLEIGANAVLSKQFNLEDSMTQLRETILSLIPAHSMSKSA
jgi:CheY-like chemotaxis protein